MHSLQASRGGTRSPARGHSVQFYSRDQELLDTVAKFLAPVLRQGQGVIVLATREHRRQILHRLTNARLNPKQARENGSYIEVDAEQFLAAIMSHGRPDATRFFRMMETLIGRASSAAQGRTAVFSEAISVLCSQDQTEAALELEHLWNELAQRHNILLFCGYAACNLKREDHNTLFATICAVHSDVLPEESYLDLDREGRLRYVAELQQKVRSLEAAAAERSQSEDALARSEKLASMGRLAATIAHEINSPLTSLTNIVYLLGMDKSLDSSARRYVAMADQELRHIARITKQVLGFYRESTEPVPSRISEIMDDVLELYQPRVVKAHIDVERDYQSEGGIHGYPSELRQVFANLIGNAIDAIGSRGKIRVRISNARDWRQQPQRRGVRVTVADSGPGISRENQRVVFHPFFTTKGESGTGLGLWLSGGIVRRHGGHIHLRSRTQNQNHGTVFSIFLPGPGHASQQPAKTKQSEPWKVAA